MHSHGVTNNGHSETNNYIQLQNNLKKKNGVCPPGEYGQEFLYKYNSSSSV